MNARPRGRHKAPALIIVCGLPGAGKTTLSRRLERERYGVRLCPDEWMARMEIDFFDASRRARIEGVQWDLAQRLLALGVTVIIEWGTWARSERDSLRQRARELGAAVELCYLSAPLQVLARRVTRRGMESPPLTAQDMKRYEEQFEAPTPEETALYDRPISAE